MGVGGGHELENHRDPWRLKPRGSQRHGITFCVEQWLGKDNGVGGALAWSLALILALPASALRRKDAA